MRNAVSLVESLIRTLILMSSNVTFFLMCVPGFVVFINACRQTQRHAEKHKRLLADGLGLYIFDELSTYGQSQKRDVKNLKKM